MDNEFSQVVFTIDPIGVDAGSDPDPEAYLVYIHGKIELLLPEPADEEEWYEETELAGYLDLIYVNTAAAYAEGIPLWIVFDCQPELDGLIEIAIDKQDGGFPSEELVDLIGALGFGSGLLLVADVAIKPKFRDRNLDLLAIRSALRHASFGAEVAAICPEESRRQHYARLGFELLAGTDYMFMLTDRRLPTAKELEPKEKGDV